LAHGLVGELATGRLAEKTYTVNARLSYVIACAHIYGPKSVYTENDVKLVDKNNTGLYQIIAWISLRIIFLKSFQIQ